MNNGIIMLIIISVISSNPVKDIRKEPVIQPNKNPVVHSYIS
jgi:hypothetical protein